LIVPNNQLVAVYKQDGLAVNEVRWHQDAGYLKRFLPA
jgi:hypothetical protein